MGVAVTYETETCLRQALLTWADSIQASPDAYREARALWRRRTSWRRRTTVALLVFLLVATGLWVLVLARCLYAVLRRRRPR